jgi:hypothetical protein
MARPKKEDLLPVVYAFPSLIGPTIMCYEASTPGVRAQTLYSSMLPF